MSESFGNLCGCIFGLIIDNNNFHQLNLLQGQGFKEVLQCTFFVPVSNDNADARIITFLITGLFDARNTPKKVEAKQPE